MGLPPLGNHGVQDILHHKDPMSETRTEKLSKDKLVLKMIARGRQGKLGTQRKGHKLMEHRKLQVASQVA